MGFIMILGIAVGLAMDAFSVSIIAGVKIKGITFRHYFRIAFHFGLFQFFMPILGYYGGVWIEGIIRDYDHWIALILLSLIGGKMIWESFFSDEKEKSQSDPSRGKTLILLSIATSLDAAAVGFSLAALDVSIFRPCMIIGLVCLFFSALGVFLGSKIGPLLGIWAERLGGIILILIGLKIFL